MIAVAVTDTQNTSTKLTVIIWMWKITPARVMRSVPIVAALNVSMTSARRSDMRRDL